METMNTTQFRKIFPFFQNNSEKLIEDILSLSRHSFIGSGTLMQFEGQSCTDLELVLSGEKRIYKSSPTGKEITLYEVGPGEACPINALCVLSDTPCPLNAMAITDVSLLLIPAKDFKNLISEYEEMRALVFGSISQRIATILELLHELVFEKMDRRLFDYLVEKSENSVLSVTHQKIANDLGTAREVVSRLLKDFERKGKVILSRSSIQLTTLCWED